jgi:hypothetical protein
LAEWKVKPALRAGVIGRSSMYVMVFLWVLLDAVVAVFSRD